MGIVTENVQNLGGINMRIIGYSILAMGVAVAWQVKSAGDPGSADEMAEASNGQGVDRMIVGTTVSQDHIEGWEKRHKVNRICDGCQEYEQPYPGDLD